MFAWIRTGLSRLQKWYHHMLSYLVVNTPNYWISPIGKMLLALVKRKVRGIDQQFQVTVGPPDASLAISIIEPKSTTESTNHTTNETAEHPPKGTVLILHGIWMKGHWMRRIAQVLTEAGYRAVLVDLRGHGASTGRWLTYGRQEKKDLSQVVDELERRELLVGQLGVYGFSYGAAAAIHLAGHDLRVRAVVSAAPFSDMRDGVGDFGRTIFPGIQRIISDKQIQAAIHSGAEKATFDPHTETALTAMQRTTAPVLLLHGTNDRMLPSYHSVRLHEAGNENAELQLIPRTGHLRIGFFPSKEVSQQICDWFNRHLIQKN